MGPHGGDDSLGLLTAETKDVRKERKERKFEETLWETEKNTSVRLY